MARPRIDIDISRVQELAGRGLTQAEICAVLGISEGTLYSRKRDNEVFEDAIKAGKAAAAVEVANALYEKAVVDRDLGAIIWYEKTRRGLSDKVQQTNTNIQIDWDKVPSEKRDAFIEGRLTLDQLLAQL